MKPVDQEFLHLPNIGQQGDCLRACIAMVLELPIGVVPHFAQLHQESGPFWNAVYDWLEERGYSWRWLTSQNALQFGVDQCSIISGPSPRGNGYHAVVGVGRIIIHDPHPSRAGLSGDSATWRVAYLVKADI